MSSCVFAKDIHEIDRALTELSEQERLQDENGTRALQEEHAILHACIISKGST